MRRTLKKILPNHNVIRSNRWLRPFSSTLLHARLWHLNHRSAARAVAIGLFCGLIPGPFQMLGAAGCAVIFRANLPLAMLVTLYSNPLTIVPLYLLAYQTGRWLTGELHGFVPPPEFSAGNFVEWTSAMEQWTIAAAKPLGIGLVVLAIGLAVAGYFLTKAVWRIYLIRAWRRRQKSRR